MSVQGCSLPLLFTGSKAMVRPPAEARNFSLFQHIQTDFNLPFNGHLYKGKVTDLLALANEVTKFLRNVRKHEPSDRGSRSIKLYSLLKPSTSSTADNSQSVQMVQCMRTYWTLRQNISDIFSTYKVTSCTNHHSVKLHAWISVTQAQGHRKRWEGFETAIT